MEKKDSGLKRKFQNQQNNPPSKKKKLKKNQKSTNNLLQKKKNNNQVHYQTNLLNNENHLHAPFLLSFPHGPPLPSLFANDDPECGQITCYQKEESNLKKIVVRGERIKYKCTDNECDISSEYLIALCNRNHPQMTLVHVGKLYPMNQSLLAPLEEPEHRATKLEKDQAYEALASAFGGQKQLKILKKTRENALKEDMVIGTEKYVEGSLEKIGDIPEVPISVIPSHLLPPFDSETKDTSKVYPISGVISDGELATLGEENVFYKLLEEHKGAVEAHLPPDLPKFVSQMLLKWSKKLNDEKKQKCLYLRFLFFMIVFHKQQARKNKFFLKDYAESGIPNDVLNCFKSKFTAPKYTLNEESKRKLINHILILSMHLCSGMAIQFLPLQTDLNLTQESMKLYFLWIGCKVERCSGSSRVPYWVATLLAPIKFPEIKPKTYGRK